MKILFKLVCLVMLLTFLAGCASTPTTAPASNEPAATEAPTAAPQLSAEEQWLKDNQLGPYFTLDQDWAAIEEAAKKEGSVTVYSSSSRIEDQIAIWNEMYPDIKLEGYDTEGISTKMQEEHNAGNVIGDVFFAGDLMQLYGELYPQGIILPFIPSDYASVLPTSAEQPFAVARYGGDVWGYNSEQNTSCPISNVWQLVDGSYKNKIYFEDPLAEPDKISYFVNLIAHGDEMAAAYKENSGKEWTTDAEYGPDTPNAGWLWTKKFAKNPNLVVTPGGDEILEAMASLGMTDPAGMGNTSYSKMRDTINGEIAFTACEGLKPTMGTSGVTLLGIAANAPHPNAAKLYTKFTLSEKGFEPWNVMGDWSGRTDVPAAEGAPAFKDTGLWPDDGLLMYKIGSQVRDFWTLNALGG